MRVTVVGSGDAFNGEGRLHACYLVEDAGTGRVMVDFGATALAGLHRLGVRATDVDLFTFTHLHGDHLGGAPFLLIDAMFADPRPALHLVGPPGLEARVRALVAATYGAEMLARKETPHLTFEEIRPGERVRLPGGLVLEAFPADHQDPPEVPLCLRFTGPSGSRVAFSGDTAMCEGLLAAGDGADLLVAECTALAPPAGRHCTWEDWRKVLPTVRARRVVLTHLGRDVRRAVPRLLAEAPQGPRLDFAEDGLVLDLLPRPPDPA